MSEKVIFNVIGDRSIHCKGCEHSIKLSLERIPGVLEAIANRASQSIEITFTPSGYPIDQFTTMLGHLGYEVEKIS